MNDLYERDLISNPRSKAKSVVLTDKGMARSLEMFDHYLGETVEEPPLPSRTLAPGQN